VHNNTKKQSEALATGKGSPRHKGNYTCSIILKIRVIYIVHLDEVVLEITSSPSSKITLRAVKLRFHRPAFFLKMPFQVAFRCVTISTFGALEQLFSNVSFLAGIF